MKNHLHSLYQMVLKSLTFHLEVNQEKKKAGRPSHHLFRKTRTQRVYRLLKEYRNRRVLSILFSKLLLGKKVRLIGHKE